MYVWSISCTVNNARPAVYFLPWLSHSNWWYSHQQMVISFISCHFLSADVRNNLLKAS